MEKKKVILQCIETNPNWLRGNRTSYLKRYFGYIVIEDGEYFFKYLDDRKDIRCAFLSRFKPLSLEEIVFELNKDK